MLKSVTVVLISLAVLCVAPSVQAKPQIMITSYVNDFQFVNGNIGCPKGPWGNAFVVSFPKLIDKLPERDAEELLRLVDAYERLHGVQVESRTRVRNFEVTEDMVRTQTTGPVDDAGAALCNHISQFLPL